MARAFTLSVKIIRQGKHFVAYSPALDLSTSGKSEKEAKRRFSEISGIFFDEIEEAGTLNQVLSGLGWKIRRNQQPVPPKEKSVDIRIPAFA